jgi:uncharacterized protein (DUF4415 family)
LYLLSPVRLRMGEGARRAKRFTLNRLDEGSYLPEECAIGLCTMKYPMPNKRATKKGEWHDPDDAPDMTTPYWEARFKDAIVSRGIPILPTRKVSVAIELDADVLAAFKEKGPRWQSRINEVLKEWLAKA